MNSDHDGSVNSQSSPTTPGASSQDGHQRLENIDQESPFSADIEEYIKNNFKKKLEANAQSSTFLNEDQNYEGRSLSTEIDNISPRNYPSTCPHPDCVNRSKFKQFTSDREWRNHYYRSHEKRYHCGFESCGMVFDTEAEARRHRHAKHGIGIEEVRIYRCEIQSCQARQSVFTRRDKLREHRNRWHGRFYCEVQNCRRGPGHGCKDQAALELHIRREHMPN